MTGAGGAKGNSMLLDRYRVVRLLGEGGMGTVHLARVEGAEGFTLPVVVKRMRREVRAMEAGNRLFIREAKILAKLQHPAIVGISDFGIDDGAHIMVLEYVHGYSLSAWLDYREAIATPLPVDVCLFIVRRVLDALHYAHHFDTEEGQEIEIVHRDIAPDNVLMSSRGYVRLLDFGVASMTGPQSNNSTQEGAFRGKLGYAAPETIQGQAATPRSDQYSAAVVLLEMLTHITPFLSDTMGETVARMINEIPLAPSGSRNDIPSGLDQVLAKALAKDPTHRFPEALDFSRELRKLQQADDEDVAQLVKELVRADFELLPGTIDVESLKLQEEALARVFSVTPEVAFGVLDTQPAPTQRAEDKTVEPLVRDAVQTAPRDPLRGVLWGLVAVGALIATGLGATVAFLARSNGNIEQQVVVIGGERSELSAEPSATLPQVRQNTTGEVASAVVLPSGFSSALVGEGKPVSKGNSKPKRTFKSKAKSKTKPKTKPRAKAQKRGKTLQQKLAAAVHQQGRSYEACFTKHIQGEGKFEKAVLHFSVARAGGSPQIEVEPPALAITSLGSCLKRTARKVQFPKLQEPVAFRVPVLARVSRTKGPK